MCNITEIPFTTVLLLLPGYLYDLSVAAPLAGDLQTTGYNPYDTCASTRGSMVITLHNSELARVREAMVLPLLRPEIFTGVRRPSRGVAALWAPGTVPKRLTPRPSQRVQHDFLQRLLCYACK
jgi:hypothetical protein